MTDLCSINQNHRHYWQDFKLAMFSIMQFLWLVKGTKLEHIRNNNMKQESDVQLIAEITT